MTEYPELFEKIDLLDKELDVQAAIVEKLVDQVSYLEQAVLQLERTRVVRRSNSKKGVPAVPLESQEGNA